MPVNVPAPPPEDPLQPAACEPSVCKFEICEFRPSEAEAKAATLETLAVPAPERFTNGDAAEYADRSATFSKGLRHLGSGRVDPLTFARFRNGLLAGEADSQGSLLGTYDGAPLNGPRSAHAAALIGADPRGHPVAAPPKVASRDYAAELVELYWASVLRDTAFSRYDYDATAIAAAKELDGLGAAYKGPRDSEGRVTGKTLLRGGLRKDGTTYFAGETWGPYVSQFLLHPTRMGAQPIDQKFFSYRTGVDYLTDETDWDWIQNGGFPSGEPQQDHIRRHLRDGRGLSAYARADEAIQAYLVAHLIMQNIALRANADSPYLKQKNEKPFATFGAPDVVGTLGAVARAALIAAAHQKWNVHLRHRPESGGGLVQWAKTHRADRILRRQTGGNDCLHEVILESAAVKLSHLRHGSYLLAQAYPEGAPSEPSYPSGHGAVAGACVTALKFFYDCEQPIVSYMPVLAASTNGLTLEPYRGVEAAQMTFGSELSKLGHNLSFGRGLHAGGNWRSDADAGMLLGEEVAIAFLRDQARSYRERFAIKIRKFDGGFATIGNKE